MLFSNYVLDYTQTTICGYIGLVRISLWLSVWMYAALINPLTCQYCPRDPYPPPPPHPVSGKRKKVSIQNVQAQH
jgi:hypothetical protein